MPNTSFATVDNYLGRLPDRPKPTSSIWRSTDGSVQGQFFACTLTSEFQAIHALGPGAGPQPVAYEGVARGVSPSDQGVSVWRMLDGAASDDESIALDRLCRVLHAINYFRQPAAADGADLYLSVHDRLLAAVSSNHGDAFLRILTILELPQEQIVLQLPAIGPTSRWLANYVADNYRRNGFRLAFAATRVSDAAELVRQFQPHAITLDARALKDPAALARLLALAGAAGVRIVVRKVETAATLALLEQSSSASATTVHAQGDFLARPQADLQAQAGQEAFSAGFGRSSGYGLIAPPMSYTP
jgi:EAL domain-containing protein (putative c-di-GMP-specific phosphodiesterase class I)